MKKCIKCKKDIFDKTVVCPYCSAKQTTEKDKINEAENIKNYEQASNNVLKERMSENETIRGEIQVQKKLERANIGAEYERESVKNSYDSEIRFCPKCGRELGSSSRFCPKCGTAVKRKNETEKETIKTEQKTEPKNESVTAGRKLETENKTLDIKQIEDRLRQNPKGILKIYCLVVACIYGFCALHDIRYITAYYNNMVWGILMVLAGAWNAFVLVVIGMRCRKEYGKNLIYSLFAGSAVKIVLHMYNIYETAKYYQDSNSDIYAIAAIMVAAGICYYMMKKNDFIVFGENETLLHVFQNVPWALDQAINGPNSKKEKVDKTVKEKKRYIVEDSLPKGQLQAVLLSKSFIVFAVIYTVNLGINVFTDFSIFKIAFQIFPVLFCIGIWMIYSNRYNETMSSTGFSMVNVVFTIELWLRIVAMVVIIIAIIAMDLEDVGVSLIFCTTIIMLLDTFYWWSLRKTAVSIKNIAIDNYQCFGMETSLYVIFVLILQTIIKSVGFLWACYMQNLANTLNGTLNQYGEEANSIAGYITDMLGLGYGFGYGTASGVVNSLLAPVTAWIQNTFGFSQNPLVMLLGIAVPVSSIVLLFKIRSYKTK